MRTAFPRSTACDPMCRQADLRLTGFRPGKAERAEKAEGKIKEDGTMSGRFRKLLLSAHWLGDRFRHHGFQGQRAAISRKALALLGFERHQGRELPVFWRFWRESRP